MQDERADHPIPAASHLAAEPVDESDAAHSPNPPSDQPSPPISPGESDGARSPNPASDHSSPPSSPGEDDGWVPA